LVEATAELEHVAAAQQHEHWLSTRPRRRLHHAHGDHLNVLPEVELLLPVVEPLRHESAATSELRERRPALAPGPKDLPSLYLRPPSRTRHACLPNFDRKLADTIYGSGAGVTPSRLVRLR